MKINLKWFLILMIIILLVIIYFFSNDRDSLNDRPGGSILVFEEMRGDYY